MRAFRASIPARRFPGLRHMTDEQIAEIVAKDKDARSKQPWDKTTQSSSPLDDFWCSKTVVRSQPKVRRAPVVATAAGLPPVTRHRSRRPPRSGSGTLHRGLTRPDARPYVRRRPTARPAESEAEVEEVARAGIQPVQLARGARDDRTEGQGALPHRGHAGTPPPPAPQRGIAARARPGSTHAHTRASIEDGA